MRGLTRRLYALSLLAWGICTNGDRAYRAMSNWQSLMTLGVNAFLWFLFGDTAYHIAKQRPVHSIPKQKTMKLCISFSYNYSPLVPRCRTTGLKKPTRPRQHDTAEEVHRVNAFYVFCLGTPRTTSQSKDRYTVSPNKKQ
jgi:hypothetical protein